MYVIWRQFRHFISSLLLVGVLTLLLLLGLGFFTAPPAAAVVRQQEEAPGQMLYQSRQTLRDEHGKIWQAIAFKRVRPDGNTNLYLRLVGFPGAVVLDHSQPLTLASSLGEKLTAPDISRQIFTDTAPEPHIGQYDLQPIVSQLQPEIPLILELPTVKGSTVKLPVPFSMVQEWQSVADSGSSPLEVQKWYSVAPRQS
ncbi:MAG: DUF3122 domain-containing protein [Nostochopsis sp.]